MAMEHSGTPWEEGENRNRRKTNSPHIFSRVRVAFVTPSPFFLIQIEVSGRIVFIYLQLKTSATMLKWYIKN